MSSSTMDRKAPLRASIAGKSGASDENKRTPTVATAPRLSTTRTPVTASAPSVRSSASTPRVATTSATKPSPRPLATTATLRKPALTAEEPRRPMKIATGPTQLASNSKKQDETDDHASSKRDSAGPNFMSTTASQRRSVTSSRPSVTTPTTSRPISRATITTPVRARPVSGSTATKPTVTTTISPQASRSVARAAGSTSTGKSGHGDVDDAEDKIAQLEKENRTLKARLAAQRANISGDTGDDAFDTIASDMQALEDELRESKQRAAENVKALYHELTEKKAYVEKLEEKVNELEDDQEELQEINKRLKREKKEIKLQLENLEVDFEDEQRRSEAEIATLQSKHDKGASDADLVRQTYEEALENERKKSKVAIEELTAKQREIENHVRDAENEIQLELEREQARSRETAQSITEKHEGISRLTAIKHEERVRALMAEKDVSEQSLKKALEEVESKLAAEQERHAEMTGNTHLELEELRHSAQETISLVSKLEKELEATYEGKNSREIEFQKSLEEINSDKTNLEAELVEHVGAISKLKTQFEDLQAKHASAEVRNANAEATIKTLTDELRIETEQAMLNKQSLEKSLRESEERTNSLQNELATLKDASTAVTEQSQASLETLRAANLDLQAQLESIKDAEISRAGSDSRQAEVHAKEISKLHDTIQNLTSDHVSKQAEHHRLQQNSASALSDLQKQVDALRNDSRDLQELQAQLAAINEEKTRSQEVVSQTVARLKNDLEQAQSTLAEQSQEHTGVLESKDLEIAKLQAELVEERAQLREIRHAADLAQESSEQKYRQIEREMEALKSDHATRSGISENQLFTSLQENTALNEVIAELQNTIQASQHAVEGEKSREREQVEELNNIVRAMQNTIQTHLHEIHDHKTRHEESLLRLSAITQEKEALVLEYTALETAHQKLQASQLAAGDKFVETESKLFELQEDHNRALHKAAEQNTKHNEKVESLTNDLAAAVKQVDATAVQLSAAKAIQEQYNQLLAERTSLQDRLSKIALQHNREMEEENQKYEALRSELQDRDARLRSNQHAQIAEQHEAHQQLLGELRAELTTLTEKHSVQLKQLVDDHEISRERLVADHADAIRMASLESEKATLSQNAEKLDRVTRELKTQHADDMRDVEEAHQHKIDQITREHIVQMQGLEDDMHQKMQAVETRHADELQALRDEMSSISRSIHPPDMSKPGLISERGVAPQGSGAGDVSRDIASVHQPKRADSANANEMDDKLPNGHQVGDVSLEATDWSIETSTSASAEGISISEISNDSRLNSDFIMGSLLENVRQICDEHESSRASRRRLPQRIPRFVSRDVRTPDRYAGDHYRFES